MAQRVAGGHRRSGRNPEIFGHVFRHRMADHQLRRRVQVGTFVHITYMCKVIIKKKRTLLVPSSCRMSTIFLLLCILRMWSLSGGCT